MPWTDYDDAERAPFLIDANGLMVMSGSNIRIPKEANARLIAAAPELLEALKDMLSGWRYIRQDPAHRNIYGVGWDRAQEKAEAAIAKAEGRGE
jgi:hypothetical protein